MYRWPRCDIKGPPESQRNGTKLVRPGWGLGREVYLNMLCKLKKELDDCPYTDNDTNDDTEWDMWCHANTVCCTIVCCENNMLASRDIYYGLVSLIMLCTEAWKRS